jgi:hypothetical protein
VWENWRSCVGARNGAGERVQPVRPPSLEQLEPRLLLSADLIGTEPPALPGTSASAQAILVSLNQDYEGGQKTDCSLILTYLASVDEANPQQTDVGDGTLPINVEDANSSGQSPDDMAPPVEADTGMTSTLVSTPLSQLEFSIQIAARPEDSAASAQDASACPIPVDGRDTISNTASFPIEARGPPQPVPVIR